MWRNFFGLRYWADFWNSDSLGLLALRQRHRQYPIAIFNLPD
jgi:hypothetical protein